MKKIAICDAKEQSINIPITDTDWKIIDEFKEDSRKSLTEIANKLSISIDTLKRRIQYLRENGIIQRFYPILDVKKMGLREYTIIARVKAGAENAIEDFIKWARADPRFVIVIKAVGWVNLYYAFQVENDQEYREILMEIDKRIGHITIKTFPIEVENIIH
jgi:DNA-binding Lrp family transcriptional regulator